ncbi:MAG TPA: acyltransferase [Capillimicrobium sp.]|nr:acyltransferase [Capillimicrobium sp.]
MRAAAVPVHRFPLVDAIRALAAFSIAFFHTYSAGPDATTDIGRVIERLAANLGVGVPIFFVISGFVLYRQWVAARAAGRRSPLVRAYAWRRVLRIVPAFWVAMLVAVVAFDLWDELFSSIGVAAFLFAQVYRADHVGIIGVAWSLDIEAVWYVVLPLLAAGAGWWAARHRGDEWTPVLALLGVGLVLLGALYVGDLPNSWAYLMPFWLAHFAAGMALAVISVRNWEPARRAASHGVLCVAFAAATYGVIAVSDYLVILDVPHPAWLTPFLDSALGIVVAVALMLPAIFDDGPRSRLKALVGSRPIIYLGLISYGIFLYHGTAFHLASRAGVDVYGFVPGALVGFALTIAFAAASWHLIEKPAMSLRRLVGGRREPTEPTGAGADTPALGEVGAEPAYASSSSSASTTRSAARPSP